MAVDICWSRRHLLGSWMLPWAVDFAVAVFSIVLLKWAAHLRWHVF